MKALRWPRRLKTIGRSNQRSYGAARWFAVPQGPGGSVPKLSSLIDERKKRTLWLHSSPTIIGIVVLVGVFFAIVWQLDHELWDTEREMMLPSERIGPQYSGFTEISQQNPVSMPTQSPQPTQSTSPNRNSGAHPDGKELSDAQIGPGGAALALCVHSHLRLMSELPP